MSTQTQSGRTMIHVDQLTKSYDGTRTAVDNISFDVHAGEVLGFLGPNGAGKTTTMKMLTTFLAPTSGSAQIAGYDAYEDSVEVRRRVGYLPEDTPLYKDMTVLEYLRFVCEVRAIEPSIRKASIRRAVDQCGLGDRLGFLIAELSKGYRQRVGLAQAIIHEPEVLILDEPTSGLDPNQIGEIRQVIKSIGESKTVIFSTHVMQEVQATCTRVLIIANGKIAADGTPDELQRLSAGKSTVIVEVGGARGNAEAPKALMGHLDSIEEILVLGSENGSTRFRVVAKAGQDPRADIARVLTTANDMDLLQLTPERASLEDVFRQLTSAGRSAPADTPRPEGAKEGRAS
jgi:ABC-2 type transport system ATP-binding protein